MNNNIPPTTQSIESFMVSAQPPSPSSTSYDASQWSIRIVPPTQARNSYGENPEKYTFAVPELEPVEQILQMLPTPVLVSFSEEDVTSIPNETSYGGNSLKAKEHVKRTRSVILTGTTYIIGRPRNAALEKHLEQLRSDLEKATSKNIELYSEKTRAEKNLETTLQDYRTLEDRNTELQKSLTYSAQHQAETQKVYTEAKQLNKDLRKQLDKLTEHFGKGAVSKVLEDAGFKL